MSQPLRAVLYGRCSSLKQADRDLSVPAQLDACRAHAERNGWLVVREYHDDGVSGFEDERRQVAARQKALRQEMERRQQEIELEAPGRSAPLVAYTAQQMTEMLAGRRTGARKVGWGGAKLHYLHDKYLAQDPSAGALGVNQGQVVEQSPLQEQVEQRQVPFHGRED